MERDGSDEYTTEHKNTRDDWQAAPDLHLFWCICYVMLKGMCGIG